MQYKITTHQRLALTDGNLSSFMPSVLYKVLFYSSCTASHTVTAAG